MQILNSQWGGIMSLWGLESGRVTSYITLCEIKDPVGMNHVSGWCMRMTDHIVSFS